MYQIHEDRGLLQGTRDKHRPAINIIDSRSVIRPMIDVSKLLMKTFNHCYALRAEKRYGDVRRVRSANHAHAHTLTQPVRPPPRAPRRAPLSPHHLGKLSTPGKLT
ncbi:hypothetical protein MSG28_000723 [Choristoneura fumiferana]|uniref:Uncharacterized protein n=1 Tax=Choristoneura fumiferana TaxID=7141 RepID=A0ACC0K1U4_CHOFU|nr:hypothetical protein MSG28_000723 [Choristoneura fumiferana]